MDSRFNTIKEFNQPFQVYEYSPNYTDNVFFCKDDVDKHILKCFISEIKDINCCIGLSMKAKNSLFPAIYLITKSDLGFYSIPEKMLQSNESKLPSFISYIISDHDINCLPHTLIRHEDSFRLYRNENSGTVHIKSLPILYTISTSGSTGAPKIIHVPHACIYSNIKKLTALFAITREDLILSCSPPTFDPFLVDVYLSMLTGAGLLVLREFAKEFTSDYRRIFARHRGVTFLQITPSIFKSLSAVAMEFILSNESSLRIICFGGEPFPEDLFNSSLQVSEEKQIYNLYGITEISCWSSIRKFERNHKMDLGDAIDGEVFEVRDERGDLVSEGELWIGSDSRKCLIDDEIDFASGLSFRATGDLVKKDNGKIYYQGRKGDVIKRFGLKVNLLEVEEEARKLLKDVCCVFDQQTFKIILFYTGLEREEDMIIKDLKVGALSVVPDVVCWIEDEFPLSSHGKVSKSQLIEYYYETRKSCDSVKSIEDSLKGFNVNLSFIANGGNSILALQLVNQLSRDIIYPNLIEMLLNPDITIREVLQNYSTLNIDKKDVVPETGDSEIFLKLNWTHDLGKCIDASPTVFEHKTKGICVAVGSHSTLLVVLTVATGEVLFKTNLPDRIQSKILAKDDELFVGCYDGVFYCIDFIRRSIKWKFNSKGMIKSEAILTVSNRLIFGNYADGDNLFALEMDSGDLVWSMKIGTKGILSRVEILNKGLLAIATLDGTVAIAGSEGKILKSVKLKNPIFSDPLFTKDHLIVSEVTGLIHCLTLDLNIVCSFQSGGNKFSSFLVQETESGCSLYFGCYDHSVYKLQLGISEGNLTFTLLWKTILSSTVYAKAIEFKGYVIFCATNGTIYVLNSKNGNIVHTKRIEGDIFSSPTIVNDMMLFGSRDNQLYCWNIQDI